MKWVGVVVLAVVLATEVRVEAFEMLETPYEAKGHCMKIVVATQRDGGAKCRVESAHPCVRHAAVRNGRKDVHAEGRPVTIVEETDYQDTREFVEIYGRTEEAAHKFVRAHCASVVHMPKRPRVGPGDGLDTVYELSITGSPDNRVDIVFMGDGYTADEVDKFLSDMKRTAADIFFRQTFNTWLPLYNVWAVYRASNERGIGYFSTPKDTAYQLYRDGTELRGIYYNDPDAIADSCSATGPGACDYPVVLGQDPYYGGLGGQYSISTSSPRSGIVVLRHELGHSIGGVGEEYDSGVHFGANVARTLDVVQAKWGPWLSGELREEDSQDLVQDYAWFIFNSTDTSDDYVINFSNEEGYDRWYLLFSMSGCEEDGVMSITLDGEPLDWHSCDSLDRCFYGFYSDEPLDKERTHELRWHMLTNSTTMFPRQLCSVSMLQYKNEPEFHFNNDFVSAYKTYSGGTKFRAYRSQNEHCIMRNMSSTDFCVADRENLWLKQVGAISLIDNVTVTYATTEGTATAVVDMVPFGQFRDEPVPGESYFCTWTKNGFEQPSLANQFTWTLPQSEANGEWAVSVKLVTTDVRSDPNDAMSARATFRVTSP